MGVVINQYCDIIRLITNCDPQYKTPEIIMHSFSVTYANITINDI